MENLVKYPPMNPGEYARYEELVIGLIPVRFVISCRVDGWCVYALLKYMPTDYYLAYEDDPTQPTTWDRVRDNGDKLIERYARELFPAMEGPYAY